MAKKVNQPALIAEQDGMKRYHVTDGTVSVAFSGRAYPVKDGEISLPVAEEASYRDLVQAGILIPSGNPAAE
jgi:hypothetical protein